MRSRTGSISRTIAPAPGQRRRRGRLGASLLRWQARLDAEWADRALPWLAAALLFVVWTLVALARVDRLEAGEALGRYLQGAWFLADGRAPDVTIGADENLLADRLPLAFLPIGAATRVIPATAALLSAQAAALALGVVPLWRLARNVANLRVGAAAAVLVAYAVHPAVADLDLADFQPATLAVTPLLATAYFAERRRWGWFTIGCGLTVACASEFGLVIATLGVVLILDGQRVPGTRALVGGFAWSLAAVLVQQQLGQGGLVEPGAFDDYGEGALGVLIEMVRNPFMPLGDLFREANVALLVWMLAPLLFLPLLVPRKLLPAVPLTCLYLIADVDSRGATGGGRTVPLLCFSFVAATFALARVGRPSIHRVIVDRRILLALMAAAGAFLLTQSALSPYQRPWAQGGDIEDLALRAAADAVEDDEAVRTPPQVLPLLADREEVEVLDNLPLRTTEATSGMDAVIVHVAELARPEEVHGPSLRRAFANQGFAVRAAEADVIVFAPPAGGQAVPIEP
ncbi:MAG: DUF2079 domain-containing protein [Acidimicrobiales bacterium]